MLLAAASAGPVARQEGGGSQVAGLRGMLLVARPQMRDPRFRRTVIYMLQHSRQGAMGLVVNREAGSIALDDLLPSGDAPGRRVPLHYGGPVHPGSLFLLHSPDFMLPGSEALSSYAAVTTDPEILAAIAAGKGPTQYLLVFGYAGWSPGQLEEEIRQGFWRSVPADPTVLFSSEPDRTWEALNEGELLRM